MLKILLFIIFVSLGVLADEAKHILILNSYNQSMNWVKDVTKGIKDELKHKDIVFHIENMDTKRIYSKEYLKKLYEIYKLKYSSINFSVIIASDNNAYDFLMENSNKLFKNAPIVFCGVNDFADEQISNLKNFGGVAEIFDVKSTVKLILKLHPKTKNIFIINDYLKTGRAWEKTIKKEVLIFKDKVDFSYSKNLTMKELKENISNLSKDTVVLLGVYFKDKNGEYFTYEKIGEIIANSSKVPTYCLLEFNIQKGVIGGYVISGYFQGREAGKIAKRVLNGENIENIKVKKDGVNRAVFDYRELERFNINLNLLPKNAIIKNRPYSFYKNNKELVWATIIVIAILTLLLVYLIFNIQMRIKSEDNYKFLFENSADGILILKDFTFIDCNNSTLKILGYSNKTSIIGKTPFDISPKYQADGKTSKEKSEKLIRETIQNGFNKFEWIHLKANSEKLDVEVQLNLLPSEKNLIYVVMRDISEKKRLAREKEIKEKILIQQAKMAEMGEMIGAIAHQWRQPLNALAIIIQKIKFLYDRDRLNENVIENTQIKAMKHINFMSNTIDDFRDFFKPTKGKEEFLIDEVINEVISILSAQLKAHSIEIAKNEFKDIKINGFKNEFKQVILNILNNAKDAILSKQKNQNEFKGLIEIYAHSSETLTIEISDNGGGIKKEIIDKIFNPYFTTKASGGTGVGLYMSKIIIENSMKGKIYASNTNIGAKLTIELKE